MTPLLLFALAAPPPAQFAAEATRRATAGDRAGAVPLFRAALAGNPPHAVHLLARHGLAVCLLAADPPPWPEVHDLLHPVAHDGSYPDRGEVLELLGVGYRARAATEGDGRRWDAHRWFGEAERWFADKKRPADAARCRCAVAELDLRLNRHREARAGTEPFLKDKSLAATPSRGRGLHLLALACLRLNDLQAAERAAGRVPAGDPAFPDAQLVLGMVRQRAGDAAEAVALFEAAGDRPDARFRLATLAYAAGRFAVALAMFEALPGPDAAVWRGATLVRLGRFADAHRLLEPLPVTESHLSDQRSRWLGEARLGLGEVSVAGPLRAAVEQAERVPDHLDPDARDRKQEHRLALADALLRADLPAQAADVLRRVLDENGRPKQRDEVLARLVLALARAGKWDECDGRADGFRRECGDSPWLSLVAREQAVAAVARAEAVDPNRRDERRQRLLKAVERCEAPEAADDPTVRTALAVALRGLDRPAEAAAAVRDVPGASGLRGDCLLRAGDPAGAAAALAGADTPAGRLALGHALLQLGRSADARAAFAAVSNCSTDPLAARATADGALAAARAGDPAELQKLAATDGLAAVHLAAVRPADAVRLLADARQGLPADAPADLRDLVAHRLGLALLASAKVGDARTAFDRLAGDARGRPAGAAAARRAADCRLLLADLDLRWRPTDGTRHRLREAAEECVRRAEELRHQPGDATVRPHLYLSAVSALRRLAAAEVGRAWANERRHRLHRWADRGGDGPPPAVARTDVPEQGAEHRAADVCRRLADEFPGTPVAAVARLLAADLKAERGDHRAAAGLLADLADTGLSPALAARRRVRLADALDAAGDRPAALAAVEGSSDPAAADRRAGWLLAAGDPEAAVTACGPGPSLRLGEALAVVGRFDRAAEVFAQLDGAAARYGAGWTAVQRNRLDDAVDQLRAAGDAGEVGAKARLLLGLVLAARGQPADGAVLLLGVRAGNGVSAELEWAARLEAARLTGDGLPRLLRELPPAWAAAARERLP